MWGVLFGQTQPFVTSSIAVANSFLSNQYGPLKNMLVGALLGMIVLVIIFRLFKR